MEFQSHIGFAAPNVSKIRGKSAVILEKGSFPAGNSPLAP
jgi:hypothetical protein